MLSALLIILAQRLPRHTGESPLTGFHFNDPVRTVPSVLLAATATATLIFGASLGPEGPHIVVGSTAAALLMRRAEPNVLSMVMFLGGIAAIGTIFGNHFVTAFMILEFAAMGLALKVILLPAFVALGAGYLTQIGWGAWAGIGTHGLNVPGLPDYPSVQPGDLFAGLVLTDLSISAMAAVGIAAAATVTTRLPFTSALLAMLLVGVAGAAIAPFAIIGAVSGFVVKDAVDRLKSRRSSTPPSSVDQPIT